METFSVVWMKIEVGGTHLQLSGRYLEIAVGSISRIVCVLMPTLFDRFCRASLLSVLDHFTRLTYGGKAELEVNEEEKRVSALGTG